MRVSAGKYKGRNVASLDSLDTRPTKDMVKGAIFSIIQFEIEGSTFLDLFAGSGSIGIEAISRGAKLVIFNDSARNAFKQIKDNLDSFKIASSEYHLLNYDYKVALEQIKFMNIKFNYVYIDPPYKDKIFDQVIEKLIEYQLLSSKAIVMAEVDKRDDVKEISGFNLKIHKYGNTKLLVYKMI
jgi:16S rRNA (guanine(966)-N(2))-methyltransferase RsmD